MKTIIFRLRPGQDLKKSIEDIVKKHDIKAGFIISCVGGIDQAVVRMAGAQPNKQDVRTFTDNYEIVSLVGTVSVNGVHLHTSFSAKDGTVLGGHLKEGTVINPTAKIVLGVEENLEFSREMDDKTGFKELVVR